MTNTPRDPNTNPEKMNPDQRRDPANINDPNGERDNDGQRRQQLGEQNKPGQQGGQPRPDDKRPNDKGDKPQQR